jgi:hypothetical protein
MRAQFEEKTYEVAANNEFALLGAGSSCPRCGPLACPACRARPPTSVVDVWAPGQVLESQLGFDVLVDLGGDPAEINRLLNVAVPPGMSWKSHFGTPPGVGSAPAWASLFVQYKRPDWLERRHGKFLDLFDGPYFRFGLDPDQHVVLNDLRDEARQQALVMYASPRFHTHDDLSFHRRNRLVLERTAFIALDGSKDHKHGAYDEAVAFLCSEPMQVGVTGLPGLLAATRRLELPRGDSAADSFRDHLRFLSGALSRADRRRLDSSVANSGSLDAASQFELNSAVRSILQFVGRNQLVWLVCSVAR